MEKLQKKFKFKFTEEWGDDIDYYVYEESTCDGYCVYIATYDTNTVNVSEDLYYYDSDLPQAIVDAILSHEKKEFLIYVEDLKAMHVQEAMEILGSECND